jgi:hypothetical protein
MTLNVFGSGPGVIPFEEPETSGERFHVRDFIGSTLILDVQGPKEVEGPYGTSTVIVADVTVVGDEPQKFPAAWLGSKAIIDQMRPFSGKSGVVVAVETYQNKKGQTGYRFRAPVPAEVAAAEAILAAA